MPSTSKKALDPVARIAAGLLCLTLAGAGQADSSVSSSASNAASSTSGSVSDSIQGSSNSSSGGDKKVSAGDYKVIEFADAAQKPGFVQLRLQALAATGDEFTLVLPRQAADKGGVVRVGATVAAAQRPYGLEFSNKATAQRFFLVLADDWNRELQAKPV
ncbi:hypothetical protein [Pelomonas sp. SE-A7]|uniref:hypothetical protein n=1 Tax=Pelomonas sp. SE-A7 TaxID=3054953 RepID=UPI00259CE7AD|nr:hypothetical protein [Pelomonas sp. SE-A7]MDM4768150.1 hypothetical protein [Pelomonas sp. SE-A7]